MLYDELPIFKSALDFAVYIEQVVKNFDKHHKYTIGVDLREYSKKILFLIHRANITKENRVNLLMELRDTCEEIKMLLRIAKELKAFNSFNSFEHSSKLAVGICMQAQGLPIGNLTSQFFANVYMYRFDNFIKRQLKVKSYIRYIDDFVLFDSSKERLIALKIEIEKYLKDYLLLTLREDSRLRSFNDGLDFLGYIIRPNYMLVRNRVVDNLKYKKAKFYDYYENGGDTDLPAILKYNEVIASFRAHAKHANSFNLLKKVGVV